MSTSTNYLDINEIFYSIQGEGPFIGMPAVFIRLSGCNSMCKFCDTKHDISKKMHIDEIIKTCKGILVDYNNFKPLYIITGGEPFKQNISRLANELLEHGYIVQVETNGTILPNDFTTELFEKLFIVCSPKKNHNINLELALYVDAYKFLVINDEKYYINSQVMLGYAASGKPIYVQPMDVGDPVSNKENMVATIKLSKQYGFILSPQLHKMIGVK